MRGISLLTVAILILTCLSFQARGAPIPDTGQTTCYNATTAITCPEAGEPFYGQDAQYVTNPRSYTKLDAAGADLPGVLLLLE